MTLVDLAVRAEVVVVVMVDVDGSGNEGRGEVVVACDAGNEGGGG